MAGPITKWVVMMCEWQAVRRRRPREPLSPRRVRGHVWRPRHHLHAKRTGDVRYATADLPEAHHADALPVQYRQHGGQRSPSPRRSPASCASRRFCAARISAQVSSVVASLFGPSRYARPGCRARRALLVSSAPLRVPVNTTSFRLGNCAISGACSGCDRASTRSRPPGAAPATAHHRAGRLMNAYVGARRTSLSRRILSRRARSRRARR